MYIFTHKRINCAAAACPGMGWLWLVGSLKL